MVHEGIALPLHGYRQMAMGRWPSLQFMPIPSLTPNSTLDAHLDFIIYRLFHGLQETASYSISNYGCQDYKQGQANQRRIPNRIDERRMGCEDGIICKIDERIGKATSRAKRAARPWYRIGDHWNRDRRLTQ